VGVPAAPACIPYQVNVGTPAFRNEALLPSSAGLCSRGETSLCFCALPTGEKVEPSLGIERHITRLQVVRKEHAPGVPEHTLSYRV
jgi:hypothetical protein